MEGRKEIFEMFRRALMSAAIILDKKELCRRDLELVGRTLVKIGSDLLELANNNKKEK
ncbi:MAG: hypothetical protein N2485_08680 [bacterium]|nr:hypothetical protein [bacterium]